MKPAPDAVLDRQQPDPIDEVVDAMAAPRGLLIRLTKAHLDGTKCALSGGRSVGQIQPRQL